MDTIGQRLRFIRKNKLSLSREKFVEGFNISAKTLERYENDETIPDSTFLSKMIEKYGEDVDIYWLLTGGKPDVNRVASVQDKIVLKLFRSLPPEDKMEIIGLLRAHLANIGIQDAKDALDELREEVKKEMIGGG